MRVRPILYSLTAICSNRSSFGSDSVSLWICATGLVSDIRWFYVIPEYVLRYAFLAHCAFMQRSWEILRFFGIRHKSRDGRDGVTGKAMAE